MGGLIWWAWYGGPDMGGLIWGAWYGGPGMVRTFQTLIWKCTDVEIIGYESVIQDAIHSRKGGRNSGGIVLLYKNTIHDWIQL